MRHARAFLVVSGMFFAACDGEVVQIGTGGTGTTSGNPTATNATATVTVGSTVASTAIATVAASTTGSGLPGDCNAACGKAEMCGAPAGQCQMYVDCNQPQGACLADCVNDPSIDCTELFQGLQGQGPFAACAAGCQNTMSSGATMTTGTGMMQTCQQCGQNQCQQEAIQCFQQAGQAECQAWIQCANACMDGACLDGCTMMHPGGAVLEACVCSKCSGSCGAVCN